MFAEHLVHWNEFFIQLLNLPNTFIFERRYLNTVVENMELCH